MAVTEHRPPRARLLDEPGHRAAGDVLHRVDVVVRPAVVAVRGVVERPLACADLRIGHADRDLAVPPREAVRTRVRAEVGVERAVLLHDHDDVPDLVDARERHCMPPRGCAAGERGARKQGRTCHESLHVL